MRKLFFLVLFAFGATAGAQQQPPPKENQEQLDKAAQERIRAERAAGGLGKVTEEDKRGAEVGAGPHKERRQGAARRGAREDKPKDG